MLDQDMQEARTGVIEIPDLDPDTLKQMLEYIYTGQVFIFLFIEILKKKTFHNNICWYSGRR